MNLLIAIMGDSYEKVKESERMQALRERAQIIAEAERTHPSWHRYHRYMHIAEAADISSSGARRDLEWEGITGRVKQLLAVQTAEVEAKVKTEVKEQTAEIKAEVKEETAKIKAELAEVKALLVTLLDRI